MPVEDKESNWHQNSGDVKYHLGTNFSRTYADGKILNVELLANPSHLECINPVVMGKARAE
jgi:2-oxoglutarate dehydrogenase E1 component